MGILSWFGLVKKTAVTAQIAEGGSRLYGKFGNIPPEERRPVTSVLLSKTGPHEELSSVFRDHDILGERGLNFQVGPLSRNVIFSFSDQGDLEMSEGTDSDVLDNFKFAADLKVMTRKWDHIAMGLPENVSAAMSGFNSARTANNDYSLNLYGDSDLMPADFAIFGAGPAEDPVFALFKGFMIGKDIFVTNIYERRDIDYPVSWDPSFGAIHLGELSPSSTSCCQLAQVTYKGKESANYMTYYSDILPFERSAHLAWNSGTISRSDILLGSGTAMITLSLPFCPDPENQNETDRLKDGFPAKFIEIETGWNILNPKQSAKRFTIGG